MCQLLCAAESQQLVGCLWAWAVWAAIRWELVGDFDEASNFPLVTGEEGLDERGAAHGERTVGWTLIPVFVIDRSARSQEPTVTRCPRVFPRAGLEGE